MITTLLITLLLTTHTLLPDVAAPGRLIITNHLDCRVEVTVPYHRTKTNTYLLSPGACVDLRLRNSSDSLPVTIAPIGTNCGCAIEYPDGVEDTFLKKHYITGRKHWVMTPNHSYLHIYKSRCTYAYK